MNLPSLEIIFDYFTNRQQRTKINSSFSTLSLVLCGAAQGSILGPKIFNINLNDLFFEFVDTDVCNIADDTTPFACDTDIAKLLQNLESDVASAIDWFAANFMILNQSKCHFLISGPETSVQHMHIAVGEILDHVLHKVVFFVRTFQITSLPKATFTCCIEASGPNVRK